jgi:hypothetical protein
MNTLPSNLEMSKTLLDKQQDEEKAAENKQTI